ncbi:metallophosphoesterase family protein [Methylobacterium nonmethylotrophicum]|uniref:Metallophosphoesterase n=1 Tax=Methylobacterium nonmethylotrophicum TaxID=1141884 RepID=A0A4Z0NE05_9HYPH|nr:metallophosphoesterase [Methylobacterium nonmethylotrophicum]TGD93435.1 metallophosphoesterase [Methylobacterium nonmethylotrophicum]
MTAPDSLDASPNASLLAFAHIGDLHLTGAEAENARDYRAIVAQIGEADGLDFVFLPGDNADHGRPEQYALVRAGLDTLRLPVHVITGDHDREGGSLDAFYAGLSVPRLPYAVDVRGVRCLFLDMCGPGSGGPDFRLGPDQVAWLEAALAGAEGRDCILFMHSYPADLKGEGEAAQVADLVHRGPVRLVEMGHTHYNELANDGRTVYAAARSTGQIEEGPVGYAVAALDRGVVSWRFKELSRPWPFVLITAPADRRLAQKTGHEADHEAVHAIGERFTLRALVLGPAETVECRIDDGPWQRMTRPEGGRCHEAELDWPAGARAVAVRAMSAGAEDTDLIEPATDASALPTSRGIGSDADALGAWPGRGLLGTQLGPNRNGRQW